MVKSIRIGNGCGFWGDSVDAPARLVEGGRLDYLTLEYLAELTMSILARQRQKDPQAGFATDFLDVLQSLIPFLKTQPGLKIITNAGGMNPATCAEAARDLLLRAGLKAKRIGVVSGDDLVPRLDELLADGHALAHMDSGAPLLTVRDKVVAANAYLGSAPIAEALRQGADLVITGRVADACLTVAPAMFEFGWQAHDWDRIAGATLAGHLIECGAQVSGGLWTNWREVSDYANIGYPFVDLHSDGSFVVSKPPGSSGAVNLETVAEQMLYEVGDPAAYLTPDVIADFTSVTFQQIDVDQVAASPARGSPASSQYKVSVAYRSGYTATGTLSFFGKGAEEKARLSGEIILRKLQLTGITFVDHLIEVIGAGCVVPGHGRPASSPQETLLRLSVYDPRRAVVERFTKEFAPLVTAGLPGTSGYTTGRPSVREVYAYWPALIDRSAVKPTVTVT
jgi:hypothetical protein